MPGLPSGTVTFLFSDVVGEGLDTQSPASQPALARVAALVREAVEKNRGITYKTIGYAQQSAFRTAGDAVQAAVEAQAAVLNANGGGSAQPGAYAPLVRMGLHTGATEEYGGDYSGPLLNRVARLMSVAHGGQILVTVATEELARNNLPPGVTLRDLGEHRLKDLTRPERIFQVTAPVAPWNLPDDFPPLQTLESRPNNLPLQSTALIGREMEVRECCEMLRRDDVWLLTLTGPAGTGKTRLALQVAAELLDDFRDGVFFVRLADTLNPGHLLSAVEQTLGVRDEAGKSPSEPLKEYLCSRQMLLVLDNFEQIVSAAPDVADLLSAAPQLKVLVTSRTPLRLSAEREFPVPPLGLPDPRQVPSLEQLRGYEAVALFVARAVQANPAFELNEQNAPAVAEICYRLDGLPLAIELAAARVKLLPPQALLPRLENTLKLLTGGSRDLPARQQTMRATIDWSYDLLEKPEQDLLGVLSVFSGGCTLTSAETVCGDLPLDIIVLDGLESLVDKNLVRRRDAGEDEPRFTMLHTIREYAAEKLGASGHLASAREAHAKCFLALAEQAEPELKGPQQVLWLNRLGIENENLQDALHWLTEREDFETAGRLAGALVRFWFRRGYLSEGRRWLQLLIQHKDALSESVLAQVYHGAGVMAYEQGDPDEAKGWFESSIELRRKLGDKWGMIASLNNLANVALYKGDYHKAEELYGEALAQSRALDDGWSVAVTLANRGWVDMNLGEYDRALNAYRESLDLRKDLGDSWGIASALANMAWAHVYEGNYAEAARLAEESLGRFSELGDREYAADALDIMGRAALEQGDYDRAGRLLQECFASFNQIADRSGMALALCGLAVLAAREDNHAKGAVRAARLFGAADALINATAPFQRRYFESHIAEAHDKMDAAAWARAWEDGRSMTAEQVAEYALNDSKDT